jgi:NAD(P)-dependent dehydrogenase (short-subunit alcohol dehydrogenase family)
MVASLCKFGERSFSLSDQELFSRLSGDYNPAHLNELIARRSIFGGVVVHGIHLFLHVLESWCAIDQRCLWLESIKLEFQHHLHLDRDVSCAAEKLDETRVKFEVRHGSVVVLAAVCTYAELPKKGSSKSLPSPCPKKVCSVLSIDEIATASGSLSLYFDRTLSGKMFPHITSLLPSEQIALMLATTRLVGMDCPGLHSVFAGLTLSFSADTFDMESLDYRVAKVVSGLSLVKIDFSALGTEGHIRAFLRPPAKNQQSYLELASNIVPGEFSGQNALVIGGSRGLGEVTAKLLSAGGADIKFTYYRGVEEATRIREEIVAGGGRADCFDLNVLEKSAGVVEKLEGDWLPTHLYYYATPFIFDATTKEYSEDIFQRFYKFYVKGFTATVESLFGLGMDRLNVLYPSSVAVDDTPQNMKEYAAAKLAGEKRCISLQQEMKGIRISALRFPRLATDQTASILKVKNEDPVPVILKELRELHQL